MNAPAITCMALCGLALGLCLAMQGLATLASWIWFPGINHCPAECLSSRMQVGVIVLTVSSCMSMGGTIILFAGANIITLYRKYVLLSLIMQGSVTSLLGLQLTVHCISPGWYATQSAISNAVRGFTEFLQILSFLIVDLVIFQRALKLRESVLQVLDVPKTGCARCWHRPLLHFHKIFACHALASLAAAVSRFFHGSTMNRLHLALFFLPTLVARFIFTTSVLRLFLVPVQTLRSGMRTVWGQNRKSHLSAYKAVADIQFLVIVGNFIFYLVLQTFQIHVLIELESDYELWLIKTGMFIFNVLCTLLMSGALRRERREERLARKAEAIRTCKRREMASQYEPCSNEHWQTVVEDLAMRGFTLEQLLVFYKMLPELMPHWDPTKHRTVDVVRQAIIPDSVDQRCAYAVKMMGGSKTRPMKMVTHNWSNLFRDLVSATIADALDEPDFSLIAHLLDTNYPALEDALPLDAMQRTYWICAFSVNQHASICASNPGSTKDPTTNLVHPTCSCSLEKYFNGTPPVREDGKGISCQMNKFDDMIAYLASTDLDFSQVIAVDRNFGLFGRAWCVAELAEADKRGMHQHLKIHSKASLEKAEHWLSDLKIQDMQAARPEDVHEILAKIPDVQVFNGRLQEILFGKAGLLVLRSNLDALQQAEQVGTFTRLAAMLAPLSGPCKTSGVNEDMQVSLEILEGTQSTVSPQESSRDTCEESRIHKPE